jgi:hypothetical protein
MLFYVNPYVVSPIPTARVLAPPIVIVLSPFPIIGVHTQLQFGRVLDPFSNVPAIAIIIAYDFR